MKRTFIFFALIATTCAALTSSEYLPPLDDDVSSTINVDLQSLSDSSSFADDGYRYKTVKRLRFRHRRDVNELPLNEYLPPAQSEQAVADIPVFVDVPVDASQDSAALAHDGYRYKTVKRIRYRQRRDVNELPSSEYLSPAEQIQIVEDVSPASADGYRYKTVKRVVFKKRI